MKRPLGHAGAGFICFFILRDVQCSRATHLHLTGMPLESGSACTACFLISGASEPAARRTSSHYRRQKVCHSKEQKALSVSRVHAVPSHSAFNLAMCSQDWQPSPLSSPFYIGKRHSSPSLVARATLVGLSPVSDGLMMVAIVLRLPHQVPIAAH